MTSDKITKKKLAILEVLKNSTSPLSGSKITESLNIAGYDISERTVRLYLQQFNDAGLITSAGKRGRLITEAGKHEIGSSRILERVGYMSAKIDQMTYRMNFDLSLRSGTVVVNTTLVDRKVLLSRIDQINKVFAMGYAMGYLVGVLKPGDTIEGLTIPEGKVGLCTVCSITLNGVLLKHGIPVRSLFCGLMELYNYKAVRLAEIINYDGTSLDPLELFIRGGRTDYTGAISTGNGYIGIGFREFPAESYDIVLNLAEKLKKIGLGGFMEIGRSGQALFNIPVPEGCIGAIVVGGLNPVAILEENGIRVEAKALAGLMPFNQLIHYEELKNALRAIK
jgi:HTH-type transcriptional regulator, global nitrogen regulator NrpRI